MPTGMEGDFEKGVNPGTLLGRIPGFGTDIAQSWCMETVPHEPVEVPGGL
jgi:hypothetical protein